MFAPLPIYMYQVLAACVAASATELYRKRDTSGKSTPSHARQLESKAGASSPSSLDPTVESRIEAVLQSPDFQHRIVSLLKSNSPEILTAINDLRKDENLSAIATGIYESQLAAAQEFVNHNSKADVSRLRDLLRRLMPEQFHARIDQIREGQDPKTFITIHGGQNQILPNATMGVQG